MTDTVHGGFHLDTLDLCQAKARAAFVEAAVAELHTERSALVRELAEVLFATEAAVAARDAAAPVTTMTDAQRVEAMELLADPDLAECVIEDLGALGVVGEETNLLVAYLATISRKAERPFGVVVQSSTAAGKSTLADAVCQLVPEEDLASYSAVTGQALDYVGAADLAHKVLAVAEEQGASRASYALKLLVTEGRLSIASTGKDTTTGTLRTRSYEVAGPVALVLTTTATDIDPELQNRLVVLGVDEDRAQTRAIQAAQRQAATLDGLMARLQRDRIVARHRNAQRLIEPLPVVIPDSSQVPFPDHATRHRRDHQKLLSLICASALSTSTNATKTPSRSATAPSATWKPPRPMSPSSCAWLRMCSLGAVTTWLPRPGVSSPQPKPTCCRAQKPTTLVRTPSPSPAASCASSSDGPSTRCASGSPAWWPSSTWSPCPAERGVSTATCWPTTHPVNPATPRDRYATPTRGVKTAPTLAERVTPRSTPTRPTPTVGQP